MRTWILLVAIMATCGCRTHLSLRDNTLRTSSTLADLNHQQVLDNLARFVVNPSSMPAIAIVNAGTVTVADQRGINGSATAAPTETFAQQAGSGLPILSVFLNPSGSRNITENWSLAPVADIDNLRRIRCAYELLVLHGGETTDCDRCRQLLERFYLGETDRMDCVIPTGWYCVGQKKDVPKDACYFARHGDVYVWVMPGGMDGLTRFTMTIIDLATGKPHAPMKTVVKTFKADGTLDNTQVTTSEIDWDALDRMKKEQRRPERQRINSSPPIVNPGLFFVPR